MHGSNDRCVNVAREDGELAIRIEEAFVHNRRVYGSPRIHAELQAQGLRCSRKRVVRLMQTLNLSARRPKQYVVTTKSDPAAHFAPNVLSRDFAASAPNTRVGGGCHVHCDAARMARAFLPYWTCSRVPL